MSGLKCKVREWQSGKCQNSGECVYVGGGHGDLLRLKTDIYGSKEYLLIFFFFLYLCSDLKAGASDLLFLWLLSHSSHQQLYSRVRRGQEFTYYLLLKAA